MKIGKKTIIILLLIIIMMEGVRLIMAHNKVYGHCENLCEVEVIAKSNMAIVTGSQTLTAKGSESSTEYAQTVFNIDYPEGFNKDNCIVLAFEGSVFENNSKIGAYGVTPYSSANLLTGNLPRCITLLSDNMNAQVYNPSTDQKTYKYKLVLMKVD